jgi:hypothetical protein
MNENLFCVNKYLFSKKKKQKKQKNSMNKHLFFVVGQVVANWQIFVNFQKKKKELFDNGCLG